MKFSVWVLLILTLTVPAVADDRCSTATAGVTIDDLTVEGDVLTAKGTWQAGGDATGVLLEYRVDGDRLRAETWSGASDSWTVVRMDPQVEDCGQHALRMYVFPSIQDGKHQRVCLSRSLSTMRQFDIACNPIAEIADCQWQCSGGNDGSCTGTCTASVRRGSPGYVPYWGVNGEGWQSSEASSAVGPWSQPVTCKPGQRISFKVRDRKSRWSNVDEVGCGVTE